MYKIFRTNQFKKDYKKLTTKQQQKLKRVIEVLASGEKLDKFYHDHKLLGNYLGCRECHVEPDLLLIYKYDDDVLELALVRVASHSKLF